MVLFWFQPGRYFLSSYCHRKKNIENISKDDIMLLKPFQLSRVSRYGVVIILTYFDYNNECILSIIVAINSFDLVIYVFVGNMKINFLDFYYYTKNNRWYSDFRHYF